VAHENVPNSHDRGSTTKIWYSILLGNFILTLVRLLIIRLEARLYTNIGNTTTRFDVHAFGYNSAESEPIWMKTGALRVHCLGMALADFWARSAQQRELEGQAKFFVRQSTHDSTDFSSAKFHEI